MNLHDETHTTILIRFVDKCTYIQRIVRIDVPAYGLTTIA